MGIDRPTRPGASTSRAWRLALAGGGTGGHVAPGLALVDHLATGGRLAHVLWLGSGRPAEERALAGLDGAAAGASVERVVLPLERGGAPSRAATLARLPRAVLAARRALKSAGSDAVVGLGGFASASAVIAARSLGLPVVLLEVNAVRGLATRALAGLADRVLHASAASLPAGRRSRHRVVGPLLSRALLAPPPAAEVRAAWREELGFAASRPLLAVLGGSQGARALNRFVQHAAPRWVAAGLSVLHQVGPGRLAEAAGELEHYRAVEYSDRIARVLDASTAVLVRAGASTLAEVAARAVPAVVVPYPHAAGDHQRVNARALEGAVIVAEDEALDGALVERLVALCSDAGSVERAQLASRLAAAAQRAGAANTIAELEALLAARASSAHGSVGQGGSASQGGSAVQDGPRWALAEEQA